MLHLHGSVGGSAHREGAGAATVRRYVAADGWTPTAGRSAAVLVEGGRRWCARTCCGSLRTVERAVAPFRRLLTAEAKRCGSTAPGCRSTSGSCGCRGPVRGDAGLFAALSCRGVQARAAIVVVPRPGRHVRHFGGVTKEPTIRGRWCHDAATREVELQAFAAYWGFRPRACAPYRARTKKDERRRQAERHRRTPLRELGGTAGASVVAARIADRRRHGTTGEVPLVRFAPLAPVRTGRRSASCGI